MRARLQCLCCVLCLAVPGVGCSTVEAVTRRGSALEERRVGLLALEAYRSYLHEVGVRSGRPCWDSLVADSQLKRVNKSQYEVSFSRPEGDDSFSECCRVFQGFCGGVTVLIEVEPLRVVQLGIWL